MIALAAIAALGAMALIFGSKKGPGTTGATGSTPAGGPYPDLPPSPKGNYGKPIAVGHRGDPVIDEILAEMAATFTDLGVDLAWVQPWEVVRMYKAPGKPLAIPPREYWPRMAQTLREVYVPLAQQMAEYGVKLEIRNGYRAPDYNAAVGGAPNSRHQSGEALDVYVDKANSSPKNRVLLAQTLARQYINQRPGLEMGFSAYGSPTPSNVHMDTGWDRRALEEADYYIDQVRSVA